MEEEEAAYQMKATNTVIRAMTRTKEMMVMVPMKMRSCLICWSEMTLSAGMLVLAWASRAV